MDQPQRGKKYNGHDSFWDMLMWDREVGASAAILMVLIILVASYLLEENWDVVLIVLGIVVAGCFVWLFLRRRTARYNRYQRKKNREIQNVLQGRDYDSLSSFELEHIERITNYWEDRCAKLYSEK